MSSDVPSRPSRKKKAPDGGTGGGGIDYDRIISAVADRLENSFTPKMNAYIDSKMNGIRADIADMRSALEKKGAAAVAPQALDIGTITGEMQKMGLGGVAEMLKNSMPPSSPSSTSPQPQSNMEISAGLPQPPAGVNTPEQYAEWLERGGAQQPQQVQQQGQRPGVGQLNLPALIQLAQLGQMLGILPNANAPNAEMQKMLMGAAMNKMFDDMAFGATMNRMFMHKVASSMAGVEAKEIASNYMKVNEALVTGPIAKVAAQQQAAAAQNTEGQQQ